MVGERKLPSVVRAAVCDQLRRLAPAALTAVLGGVRFFSQLLVLKARPPRLKTKPSAWRVTGPHSLE